MSPQRRVAALLLTGCVLFIDGAGPIAQSPGPQPVPLPAPIPAPRDVAYPGIIQLTVDATDLQRHIFSVAETIPVRPGPTTLLYPQWLPGSHSPTGRVDKLAGLRMRANGAPLDWTRDPVDVFAFHVNIPADAATLDVAFQIASPLDANEGRIVMTPDMLNLQWNAVALYPAGYFTRQITVRATVRLPDGWQFGTALDTASTNGSVTTFTAVPFETLVDSPMFAGRYFSRLDLDPGGRVPVHLDVVADRPELLDVKPAQLETHRALVRQAYKLYGSHHYDHYDLMLALTDHMSGIGLEHHRSSENASVPGYFVEWDKNPDARDLLPHEFTHSWNGKFRRPADLWTPDYNVPMRGSLLWVYEGQTQYWGFVLAARAGLLTRQQALDALASTAATYDRRIGREWRALQDTTNDPVAALRRPLAWRSWERSEDYYSEGQLVWLDVDTLIRERSANRRSLDDFARAFYSVDDGGYVPVTYTFDDVVKTLNSVEPYDWSAFLRARLDGRGPGAPLDGIKRGGYTLVYAETPSDYFRASEVRRGVADLTYSLGMVAARDGRLTDVLWEGPAYKAGLIAGTQIVAVNGTAFDLDRLRAAVQDAKRTNGATPTELIVRNADRYRTVRIDYRDGPRYPRLERDGSAPARLDQIYAPKE